MEGYESGGFGGFILVHNTKTT